MALAELAFVFTCRSEHRHAWREPWNASLVVAVLASSAIVTALVYVPALNEPFGTVPLAPVALAICLGLSLVPAAGVELAKALRRTSSPQALPTGA